MTAPKGTAVAVTEPQPDKADRLENRLLAVAKTPQERELVFKEMSRVRQSQIIRQAANDLASQAWGKEASQAQLVALARYALETGTDPVRHWFLLGGMPYDRAELWMDLIAAEPGFIRDEPKLIHDDDRLTPEQRAERKALRVEHGVPENAPGAAIVVLHFRDRGPFQGVNWARAVGDPVGKQEPAKTALTRAYRKAAKKAVPLWFKAHPMMETFETLHVQAHDARVAGDAPLPALKSAADAPTISVTGALPPVSLAGPVGDAYEGDDAETERIRQEDLRL